MWHFTLGLAILIGTYVLLPLYQVAVMDSFLAGQYGLQSQLARVCVPLGVLIAWPIERMAGLKQRLPRPPRGYWSLILGSWLFLVHWLLSMLYRLPDALFEYSKFLNLLALLLLVYGVIRTLLAARPGTVGSDAAGSGEPRFPKYSFVLGLGILAAAIVLQPVYLAFTFRLGPVDPGAASRRMVFDGLSPILGMAIAWFLARRFAAGSLINPRATAGIWLLRIGVCGYLVAVVGFWSRIVPVLGHLLWNVPGQIFGSSFVVTLYLSPTPRILAVACIALGLIVTVLATSSSGVQSNVRPPAQPDIA